MDATNDLENVGATLAPARIVTGWRRFASGLWRLPKGDIAAAYCADILPKLRVFTHEGRMYANGGGLFGGAVRSAADCYPLVPLDEYSGPESVPYSYEGLEGRYKGRKWRLGSKVIFESDDPTVAEWKRMFNVLYADGGMFAHGVTYLEFLKERISPESPNERDAHGAELRLCESSQMPETQAEMRHWLKRVESVSAPVGHRQLEFSL